MGSDFFFFFVFFFIVFFYRGDIHEGSALEPLLFIIMINDLLKEWDERWKYVEDMPLEEIIIKNQESTLQSVLDGSEYRCRRNKMSLNPRKC